MSNTGATAPSADQRNSSNDNIMVEWLPVDASITIAEDFTASPEEKAAVADANKQPQ